VSTSKVHWDWNIVHPPWRVTGGKQIIVSRDGWGLPLELSCGVPIVLCGEVLECLEGSSLEVASVAQWSGSSSSPPGAEDAVDEGLGPCALNCSGLDVCIGGNGGWLKDIDEDAWWKPF
jgi:hypothetical protein